MRPTGSLCEGLQRQVCHFIFEFVGEDHHPEGETERETGSGEEAGADQGLLGLGPETGTEEEGPADLIPGTSTGEEAGLHPETDMTATDQGTGITRPPGAETRKLEIDPRDPGTTD